MYRVTIESARFRAHPSPAHASTSVAEVDPELADVLQVGFDERSGSWWLSCPGCDHRRTVPDESVLAPAISTFLTQHRGCH